MEKKIIIKIIIIKSELSVQAEILYILIDSAKIPEREGSISPSSLYEQLPDY